MEFIYSLSSLADMEICAATFMKSIQATNFSACLLFNSSVTVNIAKWRDGSLEQVHQELDPTSCDVKVQMQVTDSLFNLKFYCSMGTVKLFQEDLFQIMGLHFLIKDISIQ